MSNVISIHKQGNANARAPLERGGGLLDPSDTFCDRHIGPREVELREMLERIGYASLDDLCDATIPDSIRLSQPLALSALASDGASADAGGLGEHEAIERLRSIAATNAVYRSCIGMGYSDTIVPPVIQRNILENPGWYTQYTPYQSEISQGRLEALLNYQTLVADLTGLPLANASLLDEATAAAEAMSMCRAIARKKDAAFFISNDCHPQTIGVVRTRAAAIGVELNVGDTSEIDFEGHGLSGILLQYPTTSGQIEDYEELALRAHEAGCQVVVGIGMSPPGWASCWATGLPAPSTR